MPHGTAAALQLRVSEPYEGQRPGPFQPGASPQVDVGPITTGPAARTIAAVHWSTPLMDRAVGPNALSLIVTTPSLDLAHDMAEDGDSVVVEATGSGLNE